MSPLRPLRANLTSHERGSVARILLAGGGTTR
jgi:hypothetical protein